MSRLPALHDLTYSPLWNLLLIMLGSTVFALGVKAIAVPHHFLPGGLFGLGSLVYYFTRTLDPGQWFFLFNLPLFAFAWLKVSRRFCLYSLFAMVFTAMAYDVLDVRIVLHDQLHAAVAAGLICGLGAGVVLRSLGSNGGLDVFAVWLYQKYNIGVGKVYLGFNLGLFLAGAAHLSNDQIVASLIMVFITATCVDYVLALFSQRKVVFIVSDAADDIAADVLERMRQSATFLRGFGAYSRKEKNVLMTVVNNLQLKKLEEITFTRDQHALFIVENTFTVLGSSFSRRKIY